MDEDHNSRNIREERNVRYQKLLDELSELVENEDVSIQNVSTIKRILREKNHLDDEDDIKHRVQYTNETLLDANVLSSASTLLVKCVNELNLSAYDPKNFAARLINNINEGNSDDPDPMNLLKLLPDARNIIRDGPRFCSLYGTFQPPNPKVLKERKQQQQEIEKVEKKMLTRVENTNDAVGTSEIVTNLLKNLVDVYSNNNNKPIDYYQFIIDKSSFSSTVENMFYFSFLVRDGKVKLSLDDNNFKIEPVPKRELKSFRQENGVNTAMIMSITPEMWEELRANTKSHV